MKQKGFKKPVKYIVVGEPNLTKTTFIKRTGLGYFETDGLSAKEIQDISNYDLTKDVFIIGGKHYFWSPIIYDVLKKALKGNELILIVFSEVK